MLVNKVKILFFNIQHRFKKRGKNTGSFKTRGLNGKDFWNRSRSVGWRRRCQTSATADKHSSVCSPSSNTDPVPTERGEQRGEGEGRGGRGGGLKQEMRQWRVLPSPAVVRGDMEGLGLQQVSILLALSWFEPFTVTPSRRCQALL